MSVGFDRPPTEPTVLVIRNQKSPVPLSVDFELGVRDKESFVGAARPRPKRAEVPEPIDSDVLNPQKALGLDERTVRVELARHVRF
jgi:hypothetical protein